MAQNNQILNTTVEDIDRLKKVSIGNTVTNLRLQKSRLTRRVISIQTRLIELYANETIIKGRINNLANMYLIETDYAAGLQTQVKPVQAMARQDVGEDPDSAVAYNKYNLLSSVPGMKEIETELNRINSEIQNLQSQQILYENRLKDINDLLDKAEKEKTINKTAAFATPTESDLQADKIAKANYANIAILYSIMKTYHGLSIDKDGKRAYPDEEKLPPKLQALRQIFYAQAQNFPQFITGDKALDFDDPGSDKNKKLIEDEMSKQRYASASDKTMAQVEAYVKTVDQITNNTVISKGISRNASIDVSDVNSAKAYTSNYARTGIRLGTKEYLGSQTLSNIIDSLKKNTRRSIRARNATARLPLCPNAPPDPISDADNNKAEYDTRQAAIIAEGEATYNKAIAEAEAALSKKNTVEGLPDNAPDWVKQFIHAYGSSIQTNKTIKSDEYVKNIRNLNNTTSISGFKSHGSLYYQDTWVYITTGSSSTSVVSGVSVNQTIAELQEHIKNLQRNAENAEIRKTEHELNNDPLSKAEIKKLTKDIEGYKAEIKAIQKELADWNKRKEEIDKKNEATQKVALDRAIAAAKDPYNILVINVKMENTAIAEMNAYITDRNKFADIPTNLIAYKPLPLEFQQNSVFSFQRGSVWTVFVLWDNPNNNP